LRKEIEANLDRLADLMKPTTNIYASNLPKHKMEENAIEIDGASLVPRERIQGKMESRSAKKIFRPVNREELNEAVSVWFENKEETIHQFGHISSWDTRLVEDMSHLFDCKDNPKKKNFNEDIGRWDVSNVKNMRFLFHSQSSFNQESQDRLEEIKDRGLQLERENIRMKNEIKRLKEKIGVRAEEKRKETFYALYQALLPGVNFRPYGEKIQFENKGLQFVLGECYLRCVNFKEVTSEKIRRLFENADNATIETETMKDLKTLLKFLFKALNAKKIEDSSSVCTVPIIDQEPVLE